MGTPATVLGLDIGGSSTRALLVRGHTVLAELTAGSANLAAVGALAAAEAVAELRRRLPASPRPRAVCAGAAGADTPGAATALARILAGCWPEAVVDVGHDARIMLAAAGLDAGVVTISGTGSATWGRDQHGREAQAGGWGHLLGDEGSGYGLVRDAVQVALGEADRGRPPGALADGLLSAAGVADPAALRDLFYANQERRFWASLAHVVLASAAAGDRAATGIITTAADALAATTGVVLRRLGLAGPVVLAGGLAVHEPGWQSALRASVVAAGATDVRVLDREPVHGAVKLAQRLCGEPEVIDG